MIPKLAVKPPPMRLSLRKRLRPYSTLLELAEELDLTIPELKRRIRKLERSGTLSVYALTACRPDHQELASETVYDLFHQFDRCLVCGNEMKLPRKRDIGWGEFKQCEQCLFSAHDMASYSTRKQAAKDQLTKLIAEARKTECVLRDRHHHCLELREKQPLRNRK
jgi:Winged helix-turn-helix DNA-binding